ncbi:CocE/NonD family hydrolase C-terminal non-catalytic domain-containing protein [Streptomyces sp. NPDC005244]|uniref:CocE/NonD family hydrolase C-terminal non-catalytic domain-containing protein n=1 Tax=Streptomyces sp. NPDC005244 TaxID=3364708 RepID=UPI0036B975D5
MESRSDGLTFTTDPLTAPLEIMGAPVVELAHTRSNPHADVFVRLCDVDPKCVSRNFTEGFFGWTPPRPSTRRRPCACGWTPAPTRSRPATGSVC